MRRSKSCQFVIAVFLLVVSSSVIGDWRDHPEVPEWAQPGRLRWALLYGKPSKEKIDLVCEAKQTLYHGPSLADGPLAEYARKRGLHDMRYVPLTWDYKGGKLFDEAPYLREAEACKADGSRLYEYHAGRYTGCYNQPGFRKHRKIELDRTPKVASIFFDSTHMVACHCELCKKKFAEYCIANFGKEMPFPDYDGTRRTTLRDRAYRLFRCDSIVDYFSEIRAHMARHKPRQLVCPNFHWHSPDHIYLISKGVPDLVFFEEGNHPPFSRHYAGYKIAQAASHGKAVGMLIYLPPAVRSERGQKFTDYSYAGQSRTSYRSPLLPQEIMLAIAEGAACNGTYIPGYAISPKVPMLDRKNPVIAADLDALKKYYTFIANNEDLYVGMRPGARVAVLYSIRTALFHRPARQDIPAVADKLMQAGAPFEVIIEDDLNAEALAGFDCVLLPNVVCLSTEQVAALRTYTESGGSLAICGEFATQDEMGNPVKAKWPLDSGEESVKRRFGKGLIVRVKTPAKDMPAAQIRDAVGASKGIAFSVADPPESLFVNVLNKRAAKLTEIHLVNYNFSYKRIMPEAADDSGGHTARTPFVNTQFRAKKIIEIDDLAPFAKPVVKFGGRCSGKNYSLVISLNGSDIATVHAEDLTAGAWTEVPFGPALLRKRNEIVIRAIGHPNAHSDYFNLYIDTTAKTRRSSWSADGGKTYSSEDLSSFDGGVQSGEYLIRIAQASDRSKPLPPEEMLGLVTVHRAGSVRITVPNPGDRELYALAISPDAPPRKLNISLRGDKAEIQTPETYIYQIVLISQDQELLQTIHGRERAAHLDD